MIRFLGKTIFAVICAVGAFAFARAILNFVRFAGFDSSQTFVPLLMGAGIYLLLWIAFFAWREPFWSVLEHEFIHLIFAVLCFKKVHSIYASRQGGRVETEGENFVIALAPYFFPLTTVIVLLFKPAVGYDGQFLLNGLLGFTLMFHLIYLAKEFHFKQPDLRKNGFLFSTAVIVFFNVLFIGLSIAALRGSWHDMGLYLLAGVEEYQSYLEYTGRTIWQSAFARMP